MQSPIFDTILRSFEWFVDPHGIKYKVASNLTCIAHKLSGLKKRKKKKG